MKTLILKGEPDNVNRVWLLSIRYSGTHYMWNHFQMLGYQQCVVFWDKMTQRGPTGPNQYLHAHLDVGFEYVTHLTMEKVVMPMRNPIAVFKTFIYRHWNSWSVEQFEPHLLDAYERFTAAYAKYNAFIFLVDDGDQHQQFYQLSDFLNSNPGIYEQQDNNVATTRKADFTEANGFPKQMVGLYNNPPESILELAQQYGY